MQVEFWKKSTQGKEMIFLKDHKNKVQFPVFNKHNIFQLKELAKNTVLSPLLFNIVLEVIATTIREEKK